MDALVDQVLGDRYRLTTLLGKQTGRRTYLAQDQGTGQQVVIKLLLFGPDFNWDDLKLFEREAEVLKSLDHPAIPRYLDYFDIETELGKGFGLVQTYIPAPSLQEWLNQGRHFSEEDLHRIARDLLDILIYLHGRFPPVIHRDIKPSNILLGDRSGHSPGSIYLVDFGSVQTSHQGGTRTIVGTYGYMPPEQFGGHTVPASDLYGLGATLIYLASGRSPDSLPQKQMRRLFQGYVSLRPSMVHWLETLTDPALEQRFSSASQALHALTSGLSTPKTAPQTTGKLTRPLGSTVQLRETPEVLEILIPPHGFHLGLIPIGFFAIAWNSFLVMWYSIAIASWSEFGWFAALFASGHLAVGLGLIWFILFTLFGQVRLRITKTDIRFRREMFGFPCSRGIQAPRYAIGQLEFNRQSRRKDSDGDIVQVNPHIILWAGTKKIELGENGRLKEPELEWLAERLSGWLKVQIKK
ncbi:serine/threonine protein kinase [Candidatus Synechococcus calcipolaris G9]|uniref:Serine/threonine protein kinase n=1 Tax=Candidatus Synechococcus calcipolaris G9 TaxID=1497997 RepID=A0ABT6EV80_9SYNE|nr:serine/threonine-protein kinase [Candidatus Synechococcus calcipolaris]MDG2989731.1 serine/threonine protein kinase [Candidatus Synechococcus calcipolaris G9]